MTLSRIVCRVNMHDIAKFWRDLNIPTRDIHNFMEIVMVSEMGIKNILVRANEIETKSSSCSSFPSLALTGGLASWLVDWMDGGCMEGRKDSWKASVDGWMEGRNGWTMDACGDDWMNQSINWSIDWLIDLLIMDGWIDWLIKLIDWLINQSIDSPVDGWMDEIHRHARVRKKGWMD